MLVEDKYICWQVTGTASELVLL